LISREHADRIIEGERRREDRKARLMTLRQEAEYLGISPQELSRIENGRER
jgi:transcriptional regulator with XRE-family HTH domain